MIKADMWHEIHSLRRLQETKKSIARALGLHIQTVRKVLRQAAPRPYERTKDERGLLTPYKSYILQRLAGVKSLEEANVFLELYLDTFNRRFMKEALEPGDFHRPLPKSVNLEDVLCIKGLRTINEGYLVKWRDRTFVLGKGSLTLRRQKVTVLNRFDGRLSLRFKVRDLAYREIQEPRPAEPKPVLVKPRRKPPKYYPPATHPWRHMSFGNVP